ncbi:hypothetical protein AMTRI_Chr03g148080 [Amborella trichopoda]
MMRAKTHLSMPQDIYTYIHIQTLHTLHTRTHAYETFFSCKALSIYKSALLPRKEGVRSIAFVHNRALQLFVGAKPNSQLGAYQTLRMLTRWRIICRLTA